VIFAVGLLLGLVLRASILSSVRGIGNVRIRHEGLLAGLLLVSLAIPAVAGARLGQVPVWSLWIASMALLLVLAIFNSRNARGFAVLSAGVAFNLIAIALNHRMPVSLISVMAVDATAGARAILAGDAFHRMSTAATRLLLLGDVIPLPGMRGLRGVLSMGDVLMLVGIAIVIVSADPERTPVPAEKAS
jgi:hypothetical protein